MLDIMKRAASAVLPVPMMQRLRAIRAIQRGDNPELKLLPQFNRGGIMIDIGANIGDWSHVGARVFRRVVAFEPNPDLAAKLRQELPRRNVRVIDVALGAAPGGCATLYVPVRRDGSPDTGLASLDPEANGGEMRTVEVRVNCLDDYGFDDIDLIKIDVEGFEQATLNGAVGTIRRCRPVLIVEIEDRHHPGQTRQVFDLIASLAYHAHYLMDGQMVPYDVAGHSDAPNLGALGQYINNFIFTPR